MIFIFLVGLSGLDIEEFSLKLVRFNFMILVGFILNFFNNYSVDFFFYNGGVLFIFLLVIVRFWDLVFSSF